MKPQCNTSADCLRELARVMDQFGIDDPFEAVLSEYVKCNDKRWSVEKFPTFNRPELWQFAIAEVEGKPVFLYDELFDSHGCKWIITTHEEGYLYAEMSNGIRREFDPKAISWNPPRPKTVMVELTVEDAKFLVANFVEPTNIHIACKTALEKLK